MKDFKCNIRYFITISFFCLLFAVCYFFVTNVFLAFYIGVSFHYINEYIQDKVKKILGE